jgi:hypothetical protein
MHLPHLQYALIDRFIPETATREKENVFCQSENIFYFRTLVEDPGGGIRKSGLQDFQPKTKIRNDPSAGAKPVSVM